MVELHGPCSVEKGSTKIDNSILNTNLNYNELITQIHNVRVKRLTPKQKQFVRISYDKHMLTGELFSEGDFPFLTNVNFRQKIYELKDIIVKEIPGSPPLYRLKFIQLHKSITKKGTGVNSSFINQKLQQLYALAIKQPPQMHDIKLSSKTSQLYENLQLQPDIEPNKVNKQFLIPILANSRFDSKAQISPNGRMDVHIGCSQHPIDCSSEGFSELIEYIGEIKHFLRTRANSDFFSEPAHKWMFEYYHFNRDSEAIVNPEYKFSLGQHNNFLYIKKFDDGTIKVRYEKKKTPKKTISQEQQDLKARGLLCP